MSCFALNNFVTAVSPSQHCAHNMSIASSLKMARPSSPFENCEGPATVLVVLGIEFDSINQAARLPADKLSALQGLISSWLPRRWCNRRKLDSRFGYLHYAANVVWPGRAFLHLHDRPFVLLPQAGSPD